MPPAGRRKKIKPVLKEGHLARETKGLRNPLLWGTFKWGGNPHAGLYSLRRQHAGHSPLLVPSSLPSCTFAGLFPTRGTAPGAASGSRMRVRGTCIHTALQGTTSFSRTRTASHASLRQPTSHRKPPRAFAPTFKGWHLWSPQALNDPKKPSRLALVSTPQRCVESQGRQCPCFQKH